MLKIQYKSSSTIVRRKNPLVKAPGKPLQRVISTGYWPANKEIDYLENAELVKRGSAQKKKLKLIVPTMLSSHWVTVQAVWKCQLDKFTDPKSGDEQNIWAVEYLTINCLSVENPTGYDLSASISQTGLQSVNKGKVALPKAQYIVEFESIGPTGKKTKTKQKLEFGFLKGVFKKV